MRPGSLTSTAPGHVRDMIRTFAVKTLGRNTARITIEPVAGKYRSRWYGLFINGKFSPPLVFLNTLQTSRIVNRYFEGSNIDVRIEDFGGWSFNPYLANQLIWTNEKTKSMSRTIRFSWEVPQTFSQSNGYVSAVRDDTQVSNVVVTGVERFTNCLQTSTTTGELYFTVNQTGGTTTLNYYAANSLKFNGTNLVATGTLVGAVGSITASAVNNSGLSVTADVNYVGDGDGYVELEWPESYQLHYSTAALVFPRTPEATRTDVGSDNFYFETSNQTPGTYSAAIVPVRKGVPMAVGVVTTTGLVLNSFPAQSTITSVSGTAAATTVNWIVGEGGCTFKVYTSHINQPVNYGSFATPAVVTTALNATSSGLAVVGYPGKVHVAVRAVKAGVENYLTTEYEIEYDSTGAIVGARPNKATISGVTKAGLTLSVPTYYNTNGESVSPATVELFIKPDGTALDFTRAQATATLSVASLGVRTASLVYVAPAAGWYHMAVLAKTAGSVYGDVYTEWEEYVTNVAPTAQPDNMLITTGN